MTPAHTPALFSPHIICGISWGREQWGGPTFLEYLFSQTLPGLGHLLSHLILTPQLAGWYCVHFTNEKNWSSEWLRNLPKVIQFVRKETGVWTKVYFTPEPLLFLLNNHTCSLHQSVTSFVTSVPSKYHPGQSAGATDKAGDITGGKAKLGRVQIPHPVPLDMFTSQSEWYFTQMRVKWLIGREAVVGFLRLSVELVFYFYIANFPQT